MRASAPVVAGNQEISDDPMGRKFLGKTPSGEIDLGEDVRTDEDLPDEIDEHTFSSLSYDTCGSSREGIICRSDASDASMESEDLSQDIPRTYDVDVYSKSTIEGLRWMEWKHKFGVSEAALAAALELAGVSLSVHSLKNALLESSVHFQKVDCCPNSHVAFTGKFSDTTSCPHQGCGQARYADEKNSRSRKCFRYIPLRCRVESWFKSREFLGRMRYRQKETMRMRALFASGATFDSIPLEDYIFGRTYVAIDSKKRFCQDDVCLSLSVDGKNLFRSNDFNIWPVLLLNLNLPPDERCKIEHMIPFGFIPGPNNPKNLETFLHPLFEELKLLESGLSLTDWEGAHRTVRVFLLFVTADLPALSKVIRTRGHNALSPCRFCRIHGIYEEEKKTYYYPSAVEISEVHRQKKILWRPERIYSLLRTPRGLLKDFREIEDCVKKKEREELCKSKGLHGQPSILRFCSSLIPFQSFPIDIMHLFYENIAPYMWRYITGGSPEGSSAPFYLSAVEQVGADLEGSGKFIPGSFGRRPRNIFLQHKRFKAEEWKSFVLLYSSPLLSERLGEKYLRGWKQLVTVCRLCSVPHPTREELKTIKRCALQFYLHFEKDYFRYKKENISMMKLVFHLLLHVGQSLEDCGPLCNLDQFKVERYIGTLEKSIHSRAKAVENLELNIIQSESLKVIRRLSGEGRCSSQTKTEVRYELVSPLAGAQPNTHWLARYVTPYLVRKHGMVKGSSKTIDISDFSEYGRLQVKDGEMQVAVRSRRHCQRPGDDRERMSCHVVAFFDDDGERASWYGRVDSFYSFTWNEKLEKVALIQWCERLSKTRQGDVFASERLLFGRRTMEDVACLKTESLIGLLPRPDQRRVYVIDPRPISSQNNRQGFI